MTVKNEKAANARKESELSLAVAAQLRAERAISGITVNELASRAGVSRGTLMKLLNGQVTADVTQLDSICKVLNVPLLDLFLRAEERIRRDREAAGGDERPARHA